MQAESEYTAPKSKPSTRKVLESNDSLSVGRGKTKRCSIQWWIHGGVFS